MIETFFRLLARTVLRYWPLILAGWVILLCVAWLTPPPWNEVATDGELAHLPADMPTRVGERLRKQAFPGSIADSNIVLVASRGDECLRPDDKHFVAGPLTAGLREIAAEHGGLAGRPPLADWLPHELAELAEMVESHGVELPEPLAPLAEPPTIEPDEPAADPRIANIFSPDDVAIGRMLASADGHATIVLVGLTSNFLETRNTIILSEIETLIASLRQKDLIPEGLRIDVTGSAAIGASTIRSVTDSTKAVRHWATWIAIALLLVVFRAPLAALISLAAMYVAVEVTLAGLAWAAYYDLVSVFDGLKLYITVIVYGAGVDYSLFLIARHEEELLEGHASPAAVFRSIATVGTAIAASAGTEIIGIGLLMTASFGKFQQAGFGIAVGLLVLLIASLTLTPSILCITRRWTYWPQPLTAERRAKRLSLDWISGFVWRTIGGFQRRYPATILATVVILLTPMAVLGVVNLDHLNYGILAGLSPDDPSVRGLRVLQRHFGPGVTGPTTALLHDADADFSSPWGVRQIAQLSGGLRRRKKDIGIVDIHSLSDPLGHGERADEIINELAAIVPGKTPLERGELVVPDTEGMSPSTALFHGVVRQLAYEQYVSHTVGHDGTVTWLNLISGEDPFRSESLKQVDTIEQAVDEAMHDALQDADSYLLGAAASLRDIRDVVQTDWARIRIVVPLGVFLVLVVLLRRPIVSAYLVATVIFSFLVTYGVTYAFFWAWHPTGFPGIDWFVPVLLFTLLVAVGEDYSVLLVTRTEEERVAHSPRRGITEALVKTGGLISGAGLIMAGTFSALAFGGTMAGMHQLGFALCFGMLLDTFVVRPLMVPSFLDLLARWSRHARAATTSAE